MISKVRERAQVVALRRKGLSYREILKEVPVSKSSISLWLKDLPLSDTEKRLLKSRKDSDVSRWRIRAAASRHVAWERRNQKLLSESREEFARFVRDSFFHTGVSLYWAEGAKRSSFFGFTNSDPDMLLLMVNWITIFLGVPREQIRARLYIHKPFAHEHHEEFWVKILKIPEGNFGRTVYKPHKALVKKRSDYRGCVRIELLRISYLRKMIFWKNMLVEYHRDRR